MTLVQHIVSNPHRNPVVSLCQTISGLSYLNTAEMMTSFQRILKSTGKDANEMRQILQSRVHSLADTLKLNMDALRNSMQ